MDTWVSEIKCLLCGHVAGYSVSWRAEGNGRTVQAMRHGASRHQRCPRCGGPMFLDPSHQAPRDLGIDESRIIPRQPRAEALEDHPERCCVSCGAPVQRAERCRRCYLRHRYATNPAVRAKQLALQAQWRKRQAAASGS